jgi:trehalose-phosphatase
MRAWNELDPANAETLAPVPCPVPPGHGVARSDWVGKWPEVQQGLWQRSKILLALDFDGMAVSPADSVGALLPEDLNLLLQKLHASPRVVVAFLSSRSVRDLRSRARLENAIYVGNHGTEIEGWGLSRMDGLASSCRSDLVDVFSCLRRYARQLPGISVEDNGLSLMINGRSAAALEREKARDLLGALIQRRPRLQLTERAGGWDVFAKASWDRSHAIRQMMDHLELTPSSMVFLAGADTDQCTFSNLAAGHTFSIGDTAETAAKYQLPTRMDLMQFLLCVLCVVNEVSLT